VTVSESCKSDGSQHIVMLSGAMRIAEAILIAESKHPYLCTRSNHVNLTPAVVVPQGCFDCEWNAQRVPFFAQHDNIYATIKMSPCPLS
jgi:hypothetical protein